MVEDKGSVAFWICMICGIGVYMPWNACLQSFDFFMFNFPCEGWDVLGYSYPVLFNVPWMICQTLQFCFAYRVSFTIRIIVSFLFSAVILIMLPLIAMHVDYNIAFYIIGGLMILLGGNTSVLSASVLGLASILPPRYIGSVVTGFCISGIITGVMKIILLSTVPVGSVEQAWTFFSFGAIICVLWVVVVLYLEHNKFAQFYFSASPSPASPRGALTKKLNVFSKKVGEGGNQIGMASPKGYSITKIFARAKRDYQKQAENEIQMKLAAEKEQLQIASSESSMALDFESDEDSAKQAQLEEPFIPPSIDAEPEPFVPTIIDKPPDEPQNEVYGAKISVKRVIRFIWWDMILIFLVMMQTFALFPDLVILIPVVGLSMPWAVVSVVMTFVTGLTIGRFLAEVSFLNQRWRTAMTFVRFAWFYLFAMIVLTCPCEDKDGYPADAIWGKLWFRIIIYYIFWISTGYLQTAILVTSTFNLPQKSEDKESEAEMCGHLMSLALTTGLACGAIFGLIVYYQFTPFGYCPCTLP